MKGCVLFIALFTSGCTQLGQNSSESLEFHVEADGAAVQSDNHTYDFMKQKSFTRTQKFSVDSIQLNLTGLLAVHVTQKVGKKTESDADEVIMVKGSRGDYKCVHFYPDVPESRADTDVDDPICTFRILGFVRLTGAKMVKSAT